MREILFRGFTPDENGRETITVNGKQIKGEWVQGSYWELRKTTFCFQSDYDRYPDNTEHYIVFDQMTDWGLPNRHLRADVIPETVGQFTGLTDKNGKKIFEGDIIRFTGVKYLEYLEVFWCKSDFQWRLRNRKVTGGSRELEYDDKEWGEVIGNIHDNPELLNEK